MKIIQLFLFLAVIGFKPFVYGMEAQLVPVYNRTFATQDEGTYLDALHPDVVSRVNEYLYMSYKQDVDTIFASNTNPLTILNTLAYLHMDHSVLRVLSSPIAMYMSRYGDIQKRYAHFLNVAVLMNNKASIFTVIGLGADVNMAMNEYRETPLWFAASTENLEIIQMLLNAGADVNQAMTGGHTPLWLAIGKGNSAMTRLFLDAKADVNQRDDNGTTPLLLAAGSGSSAIVTMLIQAGAVVNCAPNLQRETPLLRAVIMDDEAAADILLKAGAELNDKILSVARGNIALKLRYHRPIRLEIM